MNVKYTLMRPALDAAGNFESTDVNIQTSYNTKQNWFEIGIVNSKSLTKIADFSFSTDTLAENEVYILSKKIKGILEDIKDLDTAEAILNLLPKQGASKVMVDVRQLLKEVE